MPPILLTVNNQSGLLRVLKYRGLDAEQIGSDLPEAARETTTGLINRANEFRVARFRGKYYCASNVGVYCLQGDGTWSTSSGLGGLAFTSPGTDAANQFATPIRSGLHLATVGGKPFLFGWYITTANTAQGYWLHPDTNTWTLGTVQSIPTSYYNNTNTGNGGVQYQFMYRGVLFMIGATPASGAYEIRTYSVSSDTWSAILSPSGIDLAGRSFVAFQNRLFMWCRRSSTGTATTWSLWELVNGTWSQVLSFSSTSFGSTIGIQSRFPAFTDGTNLYVMGVFNNGTLGWKCWQISSSFVVTDITSSVLSSGMSLNTLDMSTVGMLPIVDSISVPGETTIWLRGWNARTYGTLTTLFKWNGPTLPMTIVDVGGEISQGLPHGVISGLHAYSDYPQIVITQMTDDTVGSTFTFRAYGTGTVTVKFYLNIDGEPLTTQAQLTGPVTGGSAVLNGYQVDGVVADATGSIAYTVKFNAVGQGLTDGDFTTLVGFAS